MLVRAYTCQYATLLEIMCCGSYCEEKEDLGIRPIFFLFAHNYKPYIVLKINYIKADKIWGRLGIAV